MITYWIDHDEDEDDPPRYSNIILEEEYEEEDPDGFEGLEKGSMIDAPLSRLDIRPWDPSENFFIIV
jgi:hypothetical protein